MGGRVRTEAETEGRGHKPGDPGGLDAGGGREGAAVGEESRFDWGRQQRACDSLLLTPCLAPRPCPGCGSEASPGVQTEPRPREESLEQLIG